MSNYAVTIYELIYHTVEVSATDEDEAYDAAHRIVTGEIKGEYETESEGFTGNYYINKEEYNA
jgi:hypothetical protein